MAKRLFIAFVLMIVLTVVCVIVLPKYNLTQFSLVPMLAFAVMAVSAIVVEAERAREEEERNARENEAACGCGGECNCGDGCGCVDSCRCTKEAMLRPMGCCGPRPIGEASRLRNEQGGEGGGCGCGSGGCGR